jgi:hypothetical protein
MQEVQLLEFLSAGRIHHEAQLFAAEELIVQSLVEALPQVESVEQIRDIPNYEFSIRHPKLRQAIFAHRSSR